MPGTGVPRKKFWKGLDKCAHELAPKNKNLLDSNLTSINVGYEYAIENFKCPLETKVKRSKRTDSGIMIDGNTAAALGCVYAGATVASWYPITPSTSLVDAFDLFCKDLRNDEKTGKNNYCIFTRTFR